MNAPPGAPGPARNGNFRDLSPRVFSGLVLAAVGMAAVWAGSGWFLVLVTVAVAVMVGELHRVVSPGSAFREGILLAGLAGIAVFLSGIVATGYILPLALAPSFIGFSVLPRNRRLFGLCAALVVVAGLGMIQIRADFGIVWLSWLILVVIATDTAGYLCGRLLGGRKLWPRISPSKTWAGTIGGWIAAAGVGAVFVWIAGATFEIVAISVATAMAAQMGDIAESAVKRRMGVKDASNLIPGHGGLFDRFDGMLGAALFLQLVERTVDFPPLAVP